MNRHLKCALKLIGCIPLVIGLVVACIVSLPMIVVGILWSVAGELTGCFDFDITDANWIPMIMYFDLMTWYSNL